MPRDISFFLSILLPNLLCIVDIKVTTMAVVLAAQALLMPQQRATGTTWLAVGIPSALDPETALGKGLQWQSCALYLLCCWPISGLPVAHNFHKTKDNCVVMF